MKPINLRMQAFGPYPTEAIINFDHLSEGGLFLIHGQTGAGKTSILDGVCFALFGRSSGADRMPENLRCDLASPETPTEAELIFRLGSKTYRVVRSPAQKLKKQRGDGLTAKKPDGQIFRLLDSGEWELVASGDRKTDEAVIELLGMREDQFRQVVVLPQGQFRKFLSSGSDDRERLLEALFRTERYKSLTEELAVRARALEAEITSLRSSLSGYLSSLEVSDLADVEAKLSDLETRQKTLLEQESSIEARYSEARKRIETARTTDRTRTELTQIRERKVSLEQEKPDIAEISRRLEADRATRPVREAMAKTSSLEEDLRSLGMDSDKTREALAEATTRLGETRKKLAGLEANQNEIDALKAERESLREAFNRASKLKTQIEDTNKRKAESESAAKNAIVAEKALENANLEAMRNEKIVSALQEDSRSLDASEARLNLLVKQKAALKTDRDRVVEAEKTRVASEKQAIETRKRLAHLEEERKRSKLHFHLSQASILARELKGGEPCPVCGSLEHPNPHASANSGSSDLSAENLENVEKLVSQCEQELARDSERGRQSQENFAHSVLTLFDRIESTLGEQGRSAEVATIDRNDHDSLIATADSLLADIEARGRIIQEEIKKAKEAHSRLIEAKASYDKSIAVKSKAEADLKRTHEAKTSASTEYEKARSSLETLESSIPEELRELDKITEAGKKLKERIDKFEKELLETRELNESVVKVESAAKAKIDTLTRQIEDKSKAKSVAETECARRLKESGFKNLEDCRNAALEDELARGFEARRRKFDTDSAIVEERFGKLEQAMSEAPDWALDLAARETELTAADSARREAISERTTLSERIRQLNALREKLKESDAALKTLETRHKVLGRLAGVAKGDGNFNASRVNFSRFVLAARLDDVLEQASRRLHVMSRGQFILRRAEGSGDLRKNQGLELVVDDAHSGSTRPTASLSGGEGFMASLALALGLADEVQSRLGGLRLDAVFIDEGFGTLDQDSLDSAIKTLIDLQSGGRMVGIISHVPELKEQIVHRLVVRKSPGGSQVAWDSV